MRRGLLLGATLGGINAGVVLLLAWAMGRPGEFGWYSYSPMPRRYADYLPTDHRVGGWAAVGVVLAVLVAVNMALALAYVLVRRGRPVVD